MLREFETKRGTPFEWAGRLRLDIAFEAAIALPPSRYVDLGITDNIIYVPHMNSQVHLITGTDSCLLAWDSIPTIMIVFAFVLYCFITGGNQ